MARKEVDGHGAAPAASEDEVAAALQAAVGAAVAAGVDPEGTLRRATDRRVERLRQAEAAGD